MNQITANLHELWPRIERAGGGRNITLVAVSKTHPLATVIEAYRAGLRHFGENRAPEGNDKAAGFADWLANQPAAEPAGWHFIGHIQSRQAGQVLEGGYSLIHSVDSLKLAQRIDRLIGEHNLPPAAILLQCNVSGEDTKSGFQLHRWQADPAQLAAFLAEVEQAAALKNVTINGLMTMAPWFDDAELARPTFKSLARLQQQLQSERPDINWQHLSMGMTDDFEVALQEGATIVRIGRAIFGERHYT
ncbi:MAG: Pyridoxal phosphate homeostasis protein [Anaerolineae bacterium]|nr:Pyridoxal phosphate homeostasis protein [Anaerolineae bacterium]